MGNLIEATSPERKKAIQQAKKDTVKKLRVFFKKHGIKDLRFKVFQGLSGYVNVWAKGGFSGGHPNPGDSAKFPEDMRKLALRIVYGASSKTGGGGQSSGGNINPMDITIHFKQWEELMKLYKPSRRESTDIKSAMTDLIEDEGDYKEKRARNREMHLASFERRLIPSLEKHVKELKHSIRLYKKNPEKYRPQLDNLDDAINQIGSLHQIMSRRVSKLRFD